MIRVGKRAWLPVDRRAVHPPGGLVLVIMLITVVTLVAGSGADAHADQAQYRFERFSPHTRHVLERFWIGRVDSLGASPDLGEYLGHAVVHNPEIAAAYHRWQSALAGVELAGAWAEPTFGYGEYLVPVETKAGPQQRSISLRQRIPWFGTNGIKTDMARHQAEAERTELEAVLLSVIFEVRRVYAELGYLGRALDLTGQYVDILEQWVRVARARYETGSAGQEQLILAQIERDRLVARQAQLEDRRPVLVIELNALIGRQVSAPVSLPHLTGAPALDLDAVELGVRLLSSNPTLRGLAFRRDSQLSGEQLAARAAYPSVTMGLDYILTGSTENPSLVDDGKDPLIARFSVTLPLWGRYDAQKQRAVGQRLSAEQQLRNGQVRLQIRLAEVLSGYQEAWRNYELYGDNLLAKGRQSLVAVEAAFRAGRMGFRDLIDEQKTLLAFELSFHRATADCLIQQAAVERLIAEPVGPLSLAVQTHCPVMGGFIDTDEYVDYRGSRIFFCCSGCGAEFLIDPPRYLAKLEQEGSL